MSEIAFKTLGGSGPDIVLIHGFGSDRLSWLGNSPALMALGRVHALDLPGHGQSATDAGDGTPQALARLVNACLGASGIGKAHLVGHSLGGGIALLVAAEQPERVASLSLIAPSGLGRGIDREFLATYPDLDDPEAIAAMLRRLVVRPELINRLMVQRVKAHLDRPGVRDTLRAIASGLIRHEVELSEVAEAVAASAVPRLTFWGELDAINPLDRDRLSNFGGTSKVVAEAGHLPHIEDARAINDHLAGFLRPKLAA